MIKQSQSQQNTSKNKHDHIIITEVCTICGKVFEIQQNQPSQVIQIINQYYCQTCLEQEILTEQQNIRTLQEKYIYYKEYESSFNTKQYCEISLKNAEQSFIDLVELKQQQKQSLALDQLLIKAKQQCKLLKEKVVYIQAEEEKFWDSINRFEKRAIKLEEKALTAKLQKNTVKQQFQQLTLTSLYHKVFQITIKDNIGYIYGLAMGKKPDVPEFPWQQFNVGLGHFLLGLNILALKYGYAYVKFLKVDLRSNLTQVLLYGKDKKYSIAYSKQNQKNFGEVMQALLTQFSHFSKHILQKLHLQYNQDVKLPYSIKQKQLKIADIPINPNKINQKQKWNKWSQGVKYFLIDFKHILTIHAIYGKE